MCIASNLHNALYKRDSNTRLIHSPSVMRTDVSAIETRARCDVCIGNRTRFHPQGRDALCCKQRKLLWLYTRCYISVFVPRPLSPSSAGGGGGGRARLPRESNAFNRFEQSWRNARLICTPSRSLLKNDQHSPRCKTIYPRICSNLAELSFLFHPNFQKEIVRVTLFPLELIN